MNLSAGVVGRTYLTLFARQIIKVLYEFLLSSLGICEAPLALGHTPECNEHELERSNIVRRTVRLLLLRDGNASSSEGFSPVRQRHAFSSRREVC